MLQANIAVGREGGRAQNIRKLTINTRFDLVSVQNRAKAAKGKSLSPEENKGFEDETKEYKELAAQLAKTEIELARERAGKHTENNLKSKRKRDSKMTTKEKAARRSKLVAKMKDMIKNGCNS